MNDLSKRYREGCEAELPRNEDGSIKHETLHMCADTEARYGFDAQLWDGWEEIDSRRVKRCYLFQAFGEAYSFICRLRGSSTNHKDGSFHRVDSDAGPRVAAIQVFPDRVNSVVVVVEVKLTPGAGLGWFSI